MIYDTQTKSSVSECNAECSGDEMCSTFHFYPSDGTCELQNFSVEANFGQSDVIGGFKCAAPPASVEKLVFDHPVSYWPLDESANCAAPQAFQWKYGGNFVGNEIVRVEGIPTLEECIYRCHDHIPCQAFTFVAQTEHCILRDGTGSVEEGPLKGVVSGMRCTWRPPVAPLSLADGNWHVPRRQFTSPDPTKGLEGTCTAKQVKQGIRATLNNLAMYFLDSDETPTTVHAQKLIGIFGRVNSKKLRKCAHDGPHARSFSGADCIFDNHVNYASPENALESFCRSFERYLVQVHKPCGGKQIPRLNRIQKRCGAYLNLEWIPEELQL